MIFFNTENSAGFTMIDLLIWLVIFGVLTGTMVANFHAGGRNDAVRNSAQLVASTLREAQTKTLTGAVLSNNDFPDGGYGIHFDRNLPSQIVIFADTSLPSDYGYDAGEEIGAGPIKLAKGAEFSLADENPSFLDVVFSPPDGKIYFNGLATPGKTTITIFSTGASVQKQVEIFRLSGQIRVQ